LNQTYRNIEIIIVNDGSSDTTLSIASKYEKVKSVNIISQTNKGASAARNTGFLASKGDYIQFLDADDILDPEKISEQLKLVSDHSPDAIYAGRWGLFYDSESNAVFTPSELWSDFANPIDWLVTAWTKQKWMSPSVWLTPRHLIERAGLWDESLSLHDDGEFFCRVILKSKEVVFSKNAISYYRKGIENSLSSVISEKAIKSHYKICQLYEEHLLSCENSSRTRSACAANFRSFFYEYFPGHKDLRKKAVDASNRLGGSDIGPSGTELFYLTKGILGWRLAKLFERLYYRYGFNRASLKQSFQKLKMIWS